MGTTIIESDVDDDISGPSVGKSAYSGAPTQTQALGSGADALGNDTLVSHETVGDAPVAPITATESGDGAEHAEVENPVGGESDGEVVEASAEQLAAEAGAESAFSDLQGIEGFEIPTPPTLTESAGATYLPEAGAALEGESGTEDAEFGFLASLVPTLVSTVGPPLAKAIAGRLKPQTRRKVQAARRVVATHVGAVARPKTGASGQKAQILALISQLLESAEAAPLAEGAPPIDPALVDAAVGSH